MTLLKAESIVKHFGGVTALDGVDFSLDSGEVHILLGSNGCGKSTLCKVFSGVVKSDGGLLSVMGRSCHDMTPQKSREAGIGVVYQELSLVPNLTAAENILLGMEPLTRAGTIDKKARDRKLESIFENFRPLFPENFSLETPVYRMSPDLQQLTEIMKVMVREPEILIFDEPTASLSKTQVELFFGLVEKIRDEGKGIIFISHKMEEIFRIGDRITVMRGGRSAGCGLLSEINKDEIIKLMVGDAFSADYRKDSSLTGDESVLESLGLNGRFLKNVSFKLRKGEILGLGGLQGQGQRELLLTLFGTERTDSETVVIDKRSVRINSPRKAMKESIAFISGDRKKYGVFLSRPILENLLISKINLTAARFFSKKKLEAQAAPVTGELSLIYDKLSNPVNSLSGGNQQKVIIGRWLLNNPSIVLMDDPTKGVDVKTKKELYELIGRMCRNGCSVIWNSSDDQELLQNADRVLVFRDGSVVKELTGMSLNEDSLYRAAMDVNSEITEGGKPYEI